MSQAAEERRALVDKLASQLHARVLSGELPSGTRLRQEALAEEFGVSRTPVREALRKLQAGGLVELQPNRGAVVRGLSPTEIRDAYEVRAALEALAAGLAAERANREQLQRLGNAQAEFRAALEQTVARRQGGREVGAREIRRWGHANDEFHQTIHEASGNDVLVSTLAQLHRNFPRDLSRLVISESTTMLETNVREHKEILEALTRHDAAAASELMQRHVARAGGLVTLRVEQRATAHG
ncbi:MAG TPA: GntR family transcriptional regulator [Gaiellaceae bacterium]|nr:GntR family transcriptional regulator [Gaiellaceae bacterium]